MKKVLFPVIILTAFIGHSAMANPTTVVQIKKSVTTVGYGEGRFPAGTIRSQNGNFKTIFPYSLQIRKASFAENFDSMCEIFQPRTSRNQSLLFSVGPSSAEYSRCVLNIELSNGQIFQLVGIYSTGE
jgi:hypothetical protein